MAPSNARILQPTSVSVSDTVSDTDTPPIRPRYVSLEYRRINDLKQLRYSKDTSPVRFGYFSSPGKSPLSPVKKQPATLVPRCPHPFPHSVFPPSHAHTRRRLCRQQLLTQVPGLAAVAASRRRAPPPTHQRPLSRNSHGHLSSPFLLPSQAHLLFFLLWSLKIYHSHLLQIALSTYNVSVLTLF